jgi:hypothetical protein
MKPPITPVGKLAVIMVSSWNQTTPAGRLNELHTWYSVTGYICRDALGWSSKEGRTCRIPSRTVDFGDYLRHALPHCARNRDRFIGPGVN